MSRKNKSYQHFVNTELFQPNSMAYVENVFEEYVDGDESIALGNQLSHYKIEATKHRQLCDLLRQQKNVTTTSSSSENLLCDYYRRQGHLSVDPAQAVFLTIIPLTIDPFSI